MSELTKKKLFHYRKALNQDGTLFGDIVIIISMVLVCFITIYPLWYVFILSISDPIHAATMQVYTIPKGLYFDTYALIAKKTELWRSYGYTILYVVSQTLLTLLTSLLMGYVLSTKKLFMRKFLVFYILIPMYFGGGLIPTFLLISRLGLYNTIWALILPGSYSIWYMILVRTYFTSLGESLRESARIDGAGHYTILFKIYIPLAKPILAVIAIYTVVGVWNSYFSSLVYQPNAAIQPLQMYLRSVLVTETVDMQAGMSATEMEALVRKQLSNNQIKHAMIMFTTLPVLFVYPWFQKHFVKGVMLGSLKG